MKQDSFNGLKHLTETVTSLTHANRTAKMD